jgi:7-cyano-7-deazaguanine synthase
MDRDLVLLSGGIDSLVCAEQSRQRGSLIGCLFVDYQHPAQIQEGWKAFSYCGSRGVPLKVAHAFGLCLGDMAAQTAARVVPARNAVLIALAANAASEMGADRILIGCNAADEAEYTDCRAGFLATIAEGVGVPVAAPLLHMSKAAIIREAHRLGLRQSDSWACYGSDACGVCPSCVEAAQAWGAIND